MAKEISNNVLAGLMIAVVALSVLSTGILWVMSNDDAVDAPVIEDNGVAGAVVSLTIEDAPNSTAGVSENG
ncbi:MAG: hypothetical protein QF535_05970 [Anaerolineales bacterium]|jgi:hypothetical protein|nr:hypothetical protein [Anaerolineales bacterium]